MSFASPLLLLGLLLLPLIVLGYRYLQRRPNRYAVRYTNLDVLATVVDSTRSWRRHAGLALFLLALAALLVGFARPSVDRLADREEATIVLVIDVSGSMQAKDVKPTRLAAAQNVVRDFMKGLPEAVPGRGRLVLGDCGGRRACDLGPAARDRRDRLPLPAARDGDRRRARARRRGRPGRRGGPRRVERPPRSCFSRTARRPRAAAPARGSRAGEVLQDPRLHDRSRHA